MDSSPLVDSHAVIDATKSGPVIDSLSIVDVRPDTPETNKRSFLDKVIDSLDNSEFDPHLALRWIKKTEKPGICQKNFASNVDTFVDASYMMIANTQLGKTNSFLYLMFKAGVKAGMPSILLTQSNSAEPDRFIASKDKLNKLLEEHGKAIKANESAFQGFKVWIVCSLGLPYFSSTLACSMQQSLPFRHLRK